MPASLTDDQLAVLLQDYLTILQGHPSAETMMKEILTFTPAGGNPNTETKRVKLVKR